MSNLNFNRVYNNTNNTKDQLKRENDVHHDQHKETHEQSDSIPIICIIGPTAVGKTELSIRLAKTLNGEIINADAYQVYKYMDIGTAKPTVSEREGITHYLIDEYMPDETYNVAIFQQKAEHYIDLINSKGKVPIIVGGTGLYMKSLLYTFPLKQDEDEELKERIRQQLAALSNAELFEQLKSIDFEAAQTIHPNNRKRVIRAIEYMTIHGESITNATKQTVLNDRYKPLLIGLNTDRDVLYDRINRRIDIMINDGLFSEVYSLYDQYKNSTSFQAIGYKEWTPFIKCIEEDGIIEQSISGLSSKLYKSNLSSHSNHNINKIVTDNFMLNNVLIELKQSIINQIKQNTRKFAKRQLTYFHNQFSVMWLDPFDEILYNKLIQESIEKFKKGEY